MNLFPKRVVWCAAAALTALFLAVTAAPPAHAAPKKAAKKAPEPAKPERAPWTLRPRYTITVGDLSLDYSEMDGEWRIRRVQETEDLLNPSLLVREAGFFIELADGRVLKHDELGLRGPAVCSRDKFSSELLGPGTVYKVNLAPADGLIVTHQMASYERWPFVTMTLTLHNSTEAPVTVKRIVTAALNAGSMSGFSPSVETAGRALRVTGGFPVYDRDAKPTRMVFHDTASGLDLTIGVVPNGRSVAAVELAPGGGAWQGFVTADYAPGHVVAPGGTLEADPVWLALETDPVKMERLYSQSLHAAGFPLAAEGSPRAWAAVPDTEGFDALKKAATDAMALGVMHALVPAGWEARPGTREGGAPRWPRDMAKVAKELRSLGCTPGVTLDPLAVQGGGDAWTVKSADGQTWVNPVHPEGAEYARKQAAVLVEKGFGFLVVEPSRIPDEALAAFGVSRVEADWRALGAVCAAAAQGGRPLPVFPAAETTLDATRDAWLEASAVLGRAVDYRLNAGPVRFNVAGLSRLDPEVETAIRLWRGPVELLGDPAPGAGSALTRALSSDVLYASPQDTDNTAPLLWVSRIYAATVGGMGAVVLAFPGAEPAPVTGLEADNVENALLWRPDGDKVVTFADGMIPPVNELTTFGLCPTFERPTFMGFGEGRSFGLDKTKSLAWNEEKGILTFSLTAALSRETRGYIALAGGWKAKTVKAGGERVKAEAGDRWLIFTFPAGKTAFEAQFEK